MKYPTSTKQVAVILADTEAMPFGTMDFAIGSTGIAVRTKMFSRMDKLGKPKFGLEASKEKCLCVFFHGLSE